jgi:hypothetical protein
MGRKSAHFVPVRSGGRTPVPLDAFRNVPSPLWGADSVINKEDVAPYKTDSAIGKGDIAPGRGAGGDVVPGKKPRQASLSGFLVRGKPSEGPPDVRKGTGRSSRRGTAACADVMESEDADGLCEGPTGSGRGSELGGGHQRRLLHASGETLQAGKTEVVNSLEGKTRAAGRGKLLRVGESDLSGNETNEGKTPSEGRAPRGQALADTRTQISCSHAQTLHVDDEIAQQDVRTSDSDVGTLEVDVRIPSADVRIDSPTAAPSDEMQVPFDPERLKRRWANWRTERSEGGKSEREKKRRRQFKAASLGREEGADLEAAANELERVFNKTDFR